MVSHHFRDSTTATKQCSAVLFITFTIKEFLAMVLVVIWMMTAVLYHY